MGLLATCTNINKQNHKVISYDYIKRNHILRKQNPFAWFDACVMVYETSARQHSIMGSKMLTNDEKTPLKVFQSVVPNNGHATKFQMSSGLQNYNTVLVII